MYQASYAEAFIIIFIDFDEILFRGTGRVQKKCSFLDLAKLSSSGESNVFISNRAKKQYASKIYKGE